MRLFVAVLLLFTLWMTLPAEAQVVITGTDVQMTWTEPTASADGSALNDLANTSGFYEIPGGMETLCGTAPASSPQGGQSVTVHCTVPVGANTEANVHFRVRARDTSGNESASTPDVVHRIDHLPPAAPRFQ